MSTDTIAAIATGPAQAAVGIVRLSGPRSLEILQRLCDRTAAYQPRVATLVRVCEDHGEVIDEGLALAFPGPASYTGEDSAELQLHGSQFVLERVLSRCRELGARLAEPGEFSRRAYENGQLDLAQAEAVADLIAAESADAARAAQHSLQGVFSRRCEQLAVDVLAQRSLIEAWLDFPDEDIGDMQLAAWRQQSELTAEEIAGLTQEARSGLRMTQGFTVLIIGAPNAGKSTLLNALAQREVAIVSDIAGTTRDVLGEHLSLNGVPVRLVDTAGLREFSDDPIEREGMHRARQAAETADRIVCLSAPDAPPPVIPEEWSDRVLRVFNKSDVQGIATGRDEHGVRISAKTGGGLDLLVEELVGKPLQHTGFSARQRHVDALEDAMFHVNHSLQQMAQVSTLELAAEELRLAQEALGSITGECTTEDLLGKIFSSFCIGK